jgi:hypothetical protein
MAGTAEEKRQTDEKNAKGLLEFRVSNRQVFHRHAERTGVRLQRGQQRLDIYRTLPLEAAPQCPTLTNNDATFLDEVNPLLIRLVRIWRSLRESEQNSGSASEKFHSKGFFYRSESQLKRNGGAINGMSFL